MLGHFSRHARIPLQKGRFADYFVSKVIKSHQK